MGEIYGYARVSTQDKVTSGNIPLLDTRNKKDFLGTIIADLALQLMSAFAQMERDAIKQRQAAGIALARRGDE